MFNFTGNARRQRQVNLSGTSNPSSSSRRPGSSSTIVSAREQRAIREAERLKLRSTIKIQALFRGHTARRNIRYQLQNDWDQNWAKDGTAGFIEDDAVLEQLSRLLAFYKVDDDSDRNRLNCFITATRHMRDSTGTEHIFPSKTQARSNIRAAALLRRYTVIILDSLSSLRLRNVQDVLHEVEGYLTILVQIKDIYPDIVDGRYYTAISACINFLDQDPDFTKSIRANLPLKRSIITAIFDPLGGDDLNTVQQNCSMFAVHFLTTPFVLTFLLSVTEDRSLMWSVPMDILSRTIPSFDVYSLNTDNLLWLLAHLINIENEQRQKSTNHAERKPILLSFVSCLAWLLSAMTSKTSANLKQSEILNMYNARKAARIPGHCDKKTIEKDINVLVSQYISNQIDLIQSQAFIKEVFSTTTSSVIDLNGTQSDSSTVQDSEQAGILAHYALMLLLVFPSSAQDVRRWLYVGQSSSGEPLIKYFWRHVSHSHVFKASIHETNHVLRNLKQGSAIKVQTRPTFSQSNDWIIIFLFLEIFFFALLVMDDEEFFSGHGKALQVSDLNILSTFLKNLGFVTFWNVKEIEQNIDDIEMEDINSLDLSNKDATELKLISARDGIAGVKGISLPWLRNLTVRLLRMVYTRDSRQKFLPVDHWLMTKDVGMDGFIPAVVAEEEARQLQKLQDNDIDSSDEDSETEVGSAAASISSSLPNTRRSVFRAGYDGQKMARKNHLAAITPRLEILQNLPFFIPFKTRVEIFREFVVADQLRRRNGYLDADSWRLSVLHRSNPIFHPDGGIGKHHGRISRDNVFEDAFHEFYSLGEGLKEPIQITFIDSFGAEEAGIDGGGVTKEFLTSVAKEAFQGNSQPDSEAQPNEILFVETDENLLYPNPTIMELAKIEAESRRQSLYGTGDDLRYLSEVISEMLKRYEFLGRIIGKCLYEGILVDVVFAGFFLLKWSKAMTATDDGGLGIDDLKALDRGLWKGLQALKHYDSATIDSLCLTFSTELSVIYRDHYNKSKTRQKIISVDIKENGSNIPVTISNRLEYMHLLARHHLITQSRAQTNAFVDGLSSIISPRWLTMFNQSELQTLVGGNDSPINVEDLRRNTIYGGIYTIGDDGLEHATIVMFWNVMNNLADNDRQAVLKFVTSVSRAPLLGFSALSPHFCIRDAGSDEERLPSTSTCVNLLKLPRYTSETILSEKLLYAVRAGAGFDLS